jgi:hypothetical protein
LGRPVYFTGQHRLHQRSSAASLLQVYTAEVKRLDKSGLHKMNYNDFLTALMKLAIKASRGLLLLQPHQLGRLLVFM